MNDFATVTPDIDTDYVVWLERQVALLRERQFALLDLDNLPGELEYVVRKERNALRSRLIVAIAHLLKCEYQPGLKSRSWRLTLYAQRAKIEEILENSPSLACQVYPYARSDYAKAVRQAVFETGLPKSIFPPELPYSVAQLLDFDLIP